VIPTPEGHADGSDKVLVVNVTVLTPTVTPVISKISVYPKSLRAYPYIPIGRPDRNED
jgi:hypothetical protein